MWRLHWTAFSSQRECVWQLTQFPVACKERPGMNRIVHPDWVKLSVELNLRAKPKYEISLHYKPLSFRNFPFFNAPHVKDVLHEPSSLKLLLDPYSYSVLHNMVTIFYSTFLSNGDSYNELIAYNNSTSLVLGQNKYITRFLAFFSLLISMVNVLCIYCNVISWWSSP